MLSGVLLASISRLGGAVRTVWAATKRRLLERDTPMSSLLHVDPATLDTSNLDTTPISEFDVMGETDHRVDLEKWQLEIKGEVIKPVTFRYEELLDRPVLERNVLLICSGFFAYNGYWKGFSVAELLHEIGLKQGATHVKFSGPAGIRRKTRKFPLDEVMSDQIFIAYSVNEQPLPERHGFPIRLVAEDHKGWRWVKYINRIIVVS
jgi:sulfoxide reductase catalytic subunit YedY